MLHERGRLAEKTTSSYGHRIMDKRFLRWSVLNAWNQRRSPLNRRACYEENTMMLNETKRLVHRPEIALDITLTVATDSTVHIIIRLEFTMLTKPPGSHGLPYRLFARWSIISHLPCTICTVCLETRRFGRHAASAAGSILGIKCGTRLPRYHIRRETDLARVPMVESSDYGVSAYGTVGVNSSRDL